MNGPGENNVPNRPTFVGSSPIARAQFKNQGPTIQVTFPARY